MRLSDLPSQGHWVVNLVFGLVCLPATLEQLPLCHFGDMKQRRPWCYCYITGKASPYITTKPARLPSSLGTQELVSLPSVGQVLTEWTRSTAVFRVAVSYCLHSSGTLTNVLETAAFLWREGGRTRCSCSGVKVHIWGTPSMDCVEKAQQNLFEPQGQTS